MAKQTQEISKKIVVITLMLTKLMLESGCVKESRRRGGSLVTPQSLEMNVELKSDS